MVVDARRLNGTSVLVTGASRGIGAAVARRLAADGARVAVLSRSGAALDALVEELGGGAFAIVGDVGDAGAAELAAGAIAEATGSGPDVIVNNAGAFLVASVEDTSVEEFRSTLAVNLVAPFAFTRIFLGGMRARRHGHVVTIGSIADRTAFAGNAAYAASKYGLRALHQVLRVELRGSGVRTTLVSPGPVNTELWDPIDPDNQVGFTSRAAMLDADAVAAAVQFAVTAPSTLNVDELRLSRS